MKRALITGIGGQDSSYLTELLLGKDYAVHGIYRRHSSGDPLWRIRHLIDKQHPTGSLELHRADVTDPSALAGIINLIAPDEVYHEADQDSIGWSQANPCNQNAVTVGAALTVLETVRIRQKTYGIPGTSRTKVFIPLSTSIFGNAAVVNEHSPLDPQSPYACAKASLWHWVKHYRRNGVDVRTAIFGSHESPRRSSDYLLQKIVKAANRAELGKSVDLNLCDPTAQVDIGYAPEYMDAAWRIMQQDKPDDFVIGTGMSVSVEDLAQAAFSIRKLDWKNFSTTTKTVHPDTCPIAFCVKAENQLGWRAKTWGWELVGKLMGEGRLT